MAVKDLGTLQSEWSILYSETLPKLARSKDPAQPKWPVTLDDCFARIILDNTIGRGVLQWDSVIKKPAVKNMDEGQLNQAIRLGEKIRNGEVDLVELDQKSLQARDKGQKKYKTGEKRKRGEHRDADVAVQSVPSPKRTKDATKQLTLSFEKRGSSRQHQQISSTTEHSDTLPSTSQSEASTAKTPLANSKTADFLVKIQNHTGLTPYRKRLYSTLLSVPSGSYTTYQAMATFLESSARAVGNGMRNNPYAPDVPCHRVLASDGTIGGFYGSWGEEGEHAGKKRELLKMEGVHFDSRGKVKGPVFRNFEDLSKSQGLAEAD